MIHVYPVNQIVKDLKDILAQGVMNEATRTALEYNVLRRLEDEIRNYYDHRWGVLIEYLSNAADVDDEGIELVNFTVEDAARWVDEIEEHGWDGDSASDAAREVLKDFQQNGWILIHNYVEESTMEQADE